MASLEEILTSWGAVYAALFLPALLMLANFVFGKCFVSEALTRAQHAPHAVHARSRVVGRAYVALVTLSFAWQYYVVMFVARVAAGGVSDVGACNPAFFAWEVVDALPWVRSVPVRSLFQCRPSDLVYLGSVAVFAVLYASCVFSVPQLSRRAPPDAEKAVVSHCRRCDADIYAMDHHCYFICNCVGKRNKRLFLLCLVSGVVNLSYLLYNYLVWVMTKGDAVTNVGALLVVMFDGFLVALLGFQLLLWRRGWSTRDFLKARRQNNESLFDSARRLLR